MMRVNSKMCYSEVDPSGRYGRFNEILGKGAMKTVYKAFDEVLGMEVAWSQVLLNDLLHCPDELQRLYSEVHLLKNLNHESIIRFYNSWIDTDRRTFNFITEMLTSGTLREYRQKYKEVNIRAIKNWARQILRGLAHLHSLDPPVIHRDIKCDNIFVNGHLAQVKIGDLGLAAVLRGSQHAHSIIGTPEFMAPELYEEEYNELVDVYSYGMCVLEMLTSEYPYSECSNSAQIYKKVTAGKKPDAFHRIQNPEAKEFVAKCLEDASTRPSAHDLLLDPFLADDDDNMPVPGTPLRIYCRNAGTVEAPFLFADNYIKSTYMTITGTVNPEDNTLFLKVQISDKSGSVRHVHFPFDIVKDTAIDVAVEMVKELDINDWEPQEIAEMIEEELSSLVPLWKDVNSPKSLQQHSFNYQDDDDDNENHPPYLSSRSPSHNSLTGFADPCEESSSHDPNSVYNYHVKGNFPNSEDSFSETSCSTVGYSDIEYSTQQTEPKTGVCSRLCPKINPTTMCNDKRIGLSGKPVKCLGSTSQKKFNKIRTFMDIRTQLLQRALMQAVSKRRSAKTVGAVENIGFHDPS